MTARTASRLALLLCLLSLATAVAATVLLKLNDLRLERALDEVLSIEVALTFPLVGALIASRRPHNPIGWLLCGAGLTQGAVELSYLYARHAYVVDPGSLPGAEVAAWISAWTWMPGWGVLLTHLPLLFPTGRPPSPRWLPLAWLSGVTVAATVLLTAAVTWPLRGPLLLGDLEDEMTWLSPVLALLLACGVSAIVSLILRFRRSKGEERQQLKWFALVVSALVAVFILDVLQLPGWGRFVTLCSIILIPILPGAIAVAILRYRLYDIDRIINRTLVYGTLTVMLAGTYALISLLGAWLGSTVELLDSDLVVAGVTLAVAAAFQPLRRRTQTFIDRRFYRARYDAQRTVEDFSARLREEIDLDALTGELTIVVRGTMQPTFASVWLRR